MSANNQVLVKYHKDKWYVFDNVNAESWSEKNELEISDADGVFESNDYKVAPKEAIDLAFKLQRENPTEYGLATLLIKDGADVTLI